MEEIISAMLVGLLVGAVVVAEAMNILRERQERRYQQRITRLNKEWKTASDKRIARLNKEWKAASGVLVERIAELRNAECERQHTQRNVYRIPIESRKR